MYFYPYISYIYCCGMAMKKVCQLLSLFIITTINDRFLASLPFFPPAQITDVKFIQEMRHS